MAPRHGGGKTRETGRYREDDSMARPRASVVRDPTISLTALPTTSANIPTTPREPPLYVPPEKNKCILCLENFCKFLYNKEEKTICERTCKSWIQIVLYSIMYIIFLSTFTMICLYSSLVIINSKESFGPLSEITVPITFLRDGVGLTATPTSVDMDGKALIWYRSGEENEYQKYINALDELISSRKNKSQLIKTLGPCGQPPYGYGSKPCVIIRINKQVNWAGIPLSVNSTLTPTAPEEVQTWVRSNKKMLWLQCSGCERYDREHLGVITYHPYPPGFDPTLYPMDSNTESPLVAVQFSELPLGISLSVVCHLWHETGPSSVKFTMYVGPPSKVKKDSKRRK